MSLFGDPCQTYGSREQLLPALYVYIGDICIPWLRLLGLIANGPWFIPWSHESVRIPVQNFSFI